MGERGRGVLAAEGLVKSYRRRRVVDGVAFSVRQGEVVGLLGPNGAGKTTSFNMVVGMIRPDAGRILLDDADLTRMPMHRRARRGIGYLPQESSIFRKLTVRQNFLTCCCYLGTVFDAHGHGTQTELEAHAAAGDDPPAAAGDQAPPALPDGVDRAG